jgi:hypothetical protein
MGILGFGSRTEAEENAASIRRVPRQYLDSETREALIRRALNGDDVYAYHSGQRSNWNLWRDGRRVWLNDPNGGDAA